MKDAKIWFGAKIRIFLWHEFGIPEAHQVFVTEVCIGESFVTARAYEKVIEHIMKLPFKDGFIVLHFRFATPPPSHVNRQQFGNTQKFTNLSLLAWQLHEFPFPKVI